MEKKTFQLIWEEKTSYFLVLLVSKAPSDGQAAQMHQGQWPWRESQERGYTRGLITPRSSIDAQPPPTHLAVKARLMSTKEHQPACESVQASSLSVIMQT